VFDGCPNQEPAEKLIREVVEELGVDADIEIIEVLGNDDAVAKRFLGSPSIRINGRDLESGESQNTECSMRCRRYQSKEGPTGIPPRQMLRNALLRGQDAGTVDSD
jgi:hypothetical protein